LFFFSVTLVCTRIRPGFDVGMLVISTAGPGQRSGGEPPSRRTTAGMRVVVAVY